MRANDQTQVPGPADRGVARAGNQREVFQRAFDGNDPVQVALPCDDEGGGRNAPHLGDKVLFVNFDGGQMNGFCGNDPVDNCSDIYGGVVLPYSGDAAKRAATRDRWRSTRRSCWDPHRASSADYGRRA